MWRGFYEWLTVDGLRWCKKLFRCITTGGNIKTTLSTERREVVSFADTITADQTALPEELSELVVKCKDWRWSGTQDQVLEDIIALYTQSSGSVASTTMILSKLWISTLSLQVYASGCSLLCDYLEQIKWYWCWNRKCTRHYLFGKWYLFL